MAAGDYELQHQVREDDPNRCKTVIPNRGQCIQGAVPGSQYCPVHGGNSVINAEAAASRFRYRGTQWAARIQSHSDDPELKSVREEIGVLRLLLEEKLNACKNVTDLVIYAGPISELIVKIEKLVKTLHDMDKELGQTLDKTQLLSYADRIIQIISAEVADEDVRFKISQKIAKLFLPQVETK